MIPSLALVLAGLLGAVPARTRVLVMSLSAGEGVSAGTAQALTASALGEIRRHAGLSVMSPEQVKAVLSVERQKQLLGCASGSCLADIGGALGVDRIVTGSVARLGESWLLHLQLVDARNAAVLRTSDRRKKNGSIDDLLDELPGMVDELLGAAPASVPARPAAAATVATRAPEPAQLPSPLGAVPAQIAPDLRAKLHVVTDGAGHYIAFVPFDFTQPLLAGDGRVLSEQLVSGGRAQGTTQFEDVFWEPRSKNGRHGFFEYRDGKYTLDCGRGPTPLRELGAKQAAAVLVGAKLLAFRWQRAVEALGRDDDGTYYLVDVPRAADDLDDAHLYIGPRGAMVAVAVRDAARVGGALQLISAAGKLELPLDDASASSPPGSFKTDAGEKAVSALDLWREAGFIYGELGAYPKQLGTACDPAFAR